MRPSQEARLRETIAQRDQTIILVKEANKDSLDFYRRAYYKQRERAEELQKQLWDHENHIRKNYEGLPSQIASLQREKEKLNQQLIQERNLRIKRYRSDVRW